MSAIKVPCPLGARVMLVKEEAAKETAGGIILPDQCVEKPLIATVVGVGEGCCLVDVGEEVVYASYAGIEFKVAGVNVIVVDEEDILLVLRESPKREEAPDDE